MGPLALLCSLSYYSLSASQTKFQNLFNKPNLSTNLMDTKTLEAIRQMGASVRQVGEGFYNSSSIAGSDPHTGEPVRYDLLDILLAGAITESSVLLTGRTDSGKTDLAKIVMTALFGAEAEGWHRLDMDIDFGRDDYMDVDFGVVRDGKKISEGMYAALPFLRLPGLIVDEWNRAPPKIANKMIHFFDKDIKIGGGLRVKVGYQYGDGQSSDGRRYFFLVAAINEGEEYEGTFPIDKAARRRAVIEVPMDNFAPIIEDRLRISEGRTGRLELRAEPSITLEQRVKQLLAIKSEVEQVPVDSSAKLFLLYLQSMDHCVRSQTLSKLGVNFSEAICTKPGPGQMSAAAAGQPTTGGGACHFYTFNSGMCPAVRAISEGTSINLLRVARGFAALRAAKSSGSGAGAGDAAGNVEVVVYPEDLMVAFPLVAYSKLGLSQPWVDKQFQGSLWLAINSVLGEARRKYERAHTALAQQIDSLVKGELSADGLQAMLDYCAKDDPWFMNSLVPLLSRSRNGEELIASVGRTYPIKLLP